MYAEGQLRWPRDHWMLSGIRKIRRGQAPIFNARSRQPCCAAPQSLFWLGSSHHAPAGGENAPFSMAEWVSH
jgi:hypothetical protein